MLGQASTVITGAGSGVGRACAVRFAGEGARVVVADIDLERAKETVRLVEENGGTAVAVRTDVAREPEVVAALAAAVDAFGSLDVVVNNAGVPTPRLGSKLEDHDADDFQRLVSINLAGVFHGCKHAVLRFKEQGRGGVLVNTGSVAGLVAWGGSVYGATKAAVHQLTRAVAIEGAPFGIRANAICPAGMPDTAFMAAGGMKTDDATRKLAVRSSAESHPLGRPITAEDCAEAALFLASDRARNITGVLLPVDGGYVAR